MSTEKSPGKFRMGFITWVWKNTMTCKEISRLASQQLDVRLPLLTRLRMRLHFLICAWCRRYVKQVRLVRQVAPKYEEKVAAVSDRSLTADAKQRMKQAMQGGGGE